MASYNRIVLMGNLTREPELSYTPANTAVCKFSIATNRKWKDREGAEREEVCFVDCVLFGRSAETFNQYMSKGRQVLVEGRLTLNRWTTSEGDKRSKHEVFVENFTFLGGGRGPEGGQGGQTEAPAATATAPAPSGASTDGPPPPMDDGIPF
ncbi:MAG: single-stranded DNA-binding protein [Planctomycetes bacterium]|nr:single-stranded DNA-binding protein [Planctomycetota bacterium]